MASPWLWGLLGIGGAFVAYEFLAKPGNSILSGGNNPGLAGGDSYLGNQSIGSDSVIGETSQSSVKPSGYYLDPKSGKAVPNYVIPSRVSPLISNAAQVTQTQSSTIVRSSSTNGEVTQPRRSGGGYSSPLRITKVK